MERNDSPTYTVVLPTAVALSRCGSCSQYWRSGKRVVDTTSEAVPREQLLEPLIHHRGVSARSRTHRQSPCHKLAKQGITC